MPQPPTPPTPKSVIAARRTALWSAMRIEDPTQALHAVRQALAAGSSANDGYGTWVPLGWAIRNNALDIALALVDAGADLDVLENGKSLLGMCLLSPPMAPLVDVLIERGAKPTAPLMAVAAKRGNEKIVLWCLDAGLDPNDAPRLRAPVLTLWPAKKPIPPRLLDRSLQPPLSIRAARQIVELITRRKNLPLLQAFLDRAQPLPETRHMLLRLALAARWKTGLELLLARGYFDPAYQNPVQPSLILSCANWISAGARAAPGLQVLARLLDPIRAASSPWIAESFALLAAVKPQVRPALLDFLRQRNLPPVCQSPANDPTTQATTLAHVLIRCKDWELLRQLPSAYPATAWDMASAPGLLETWAEHLPNDRYPPATAPLPEESLAIVQALPGFDLHRRNALGESGLRRFMQRPGGRGFAAVSTQLLRAGLDPFVPDLQGLNDVDFANTMKLPLNVRADFQALALQLHVSSSTTTGNTRRL